MTQIQAKVLTKEEFQAKQKELESLNASIEIWSNSNISKENKKLINDMMNNLAKDLYALDCAYILKTIEVYSEALEIMKKPVVK
jgi:exonuclease V gamma subunit